MSKLKDRLNQAAEIRDAERAGENTALRVGTMLVDIINDTDEEIDGGCARMDGIDTDVAGLQSSVDHLSESKIDKSSMTSALGDDESKAMTQKGVKLVNDELQGQITDNAEDIGMLLNIVNKINLSAIDSVQYGIGENYGDSAGAHGSIFKVKDGNFNVGWLFCHGANCNGGQIYQTFITYFGVNSDGTLKISDHIDGAAHILRRVKFSTIAGKEVPATGEVLSANKWSKWYEIAGDDTLGRIADLEKNLQNLDTRLGDELLDLEDIYVKLSAITLETGAHDDMVMAQSVVTQELNLKLDKSALTQSTGQSTDKVMSQKTVTDLYLSNEGRIGDAEGDVAGLQSSVDHLNESKLDKASVTQELGESEEMVMSQKAVSEALRVFYPHSYGIEYDIEVASPDCTRIGNPELHRTLPIQSKMRGCLLDDDGNVVKYLPASDWRSAVRDGSQGQVMVEIPEHYRLCEIIGTKQRVLISELPLPGYHRVPKMYVSAYQATTDYTDPNTIKLASVVNFTPAFCGGNRESSWDETYKTMLGRPRTSVSRINFRKYARNRKAGDTHWNCHLYEAQKTLFWLFCIEYATRHSQKAFNAELDVNGYHQGGLGIGVSNLSAAIWQGYNNYNSFVPCGHTDELGNNTGCVDYLMENDDASISQSVSVPRYRGIENPFGHIFHWADGVNIIIHPDEANGGNGLSEIYVCSDPAKFSDDDCEGYELIGLEARAGGYVKEILFGDGGDILCKAIGAGSTTFFAGNHWTSIPTEGTALRGVLFGGFANDGSYCGFVFSNSRFAPSNTDSALGSRLCYLCD